MASQHQHNPVYGNYYGYYQKRPSLLDQRLALLPKDFFEGKVVLDVGCNEGWVTCEIAQRHRPKFVVGVDIDAELVAAAWKHRHFVWSRQSPYQDSLDPTVESLDTNAITRHETQSMEEDDPARLLSTDDTPNYDYFPASLQYSFGNLPYIRADRYRTESFPKNVVFRKADWVNEIVKEDAQGYDVILAFSIVKWIHINEGDDGVRRFFQKVFATLNPGGQFVLELQAWDGYAKAKRMDARLKDNYQNLTLRPDNFPAILENIGFTSRQSLGESGEGGFRRPVDVFTKPMQDGR